MFAHNHYKWSTWHVLWCLDLTCCTLSVQLTHVHELKDTKWGQRQPRPYGVGVWCHHAYRASLSTYWKRVMIWQLLGTARLPWAVQPRITNHCSATAGQTVSGFLKPTVYVDGWNTMPLSFYSFFGMFGFFFSMTIKAPKCFTLKNIHDTLKCTKWNLLYTFLPILELFGLPVSKSHCSHPPVSLSRTGC